MVRGDSYRQTRLHDERGNRLDLPGLRYVPRVVGEAILRKTVGYRPALPWLSYRAITAIRGLIGGESRVLEFGSGKSTVWLAGRCGFVSSVEDDPDWFEAVDQMLRTRQFSNVRLELRPLSTYSDLRADETGTFDFVLVDGMLRDACTEAAIRAVRQGGSVYLDNTDKDLAEVRDAETRLLRAVEQRGTWASYFVDFAPGNAVVIQGLLARF